MSLGRPLKLDDATRREIHALVSAGLSLQEAAQYVGCSLRTIRREQARNPQFRRTLREAALAPRDPERLMHQAAGTHWRAAAWLLERTCPQRFARRAATACTPEDVENVCGRLIEAALSEIYDGEARGRVYQRLKTVADEAVQAFASRGPSALRAPAPFTPLCDSERLTAMIDQAARRPGSLPLVPKVDKSRPDSVLNPHAAMPKNAASDNDRRGQIP